MFILTQVLLDSRGSVARQFRLFTDTEHFFVREPLGHSDYNLFRLTLLRRHYGKRETPPVFYKVAGFLPRITIARTPAICRARWTNSVETRGESLDWNLRHEYPSLSGYPLLLSTQRPMKL